MSYFYDPHLNPSYENTRRQISLSIQNLQGKLRQRKNYQMELLRQQALRQQQAYHRMQEPYNLYERPYARYEPTNANRYYNSYLQQQQLHGQHLSKIRKLQLQGNLLSQQRERQRIGRYEVGLKLYQKAPQFGGGFNDHDDSLIRKYEDGTKVQQLKQQLDMFDRKRSSDILMNKGLYKDIPSRSTQHLRNYDKKMYEDLPYSNYQKNEKYQNFNTAKKTKNQYQEYKTPYNKLYIESANKPQIKRQLYEKEKRQLYEKEKRQLHDIEHPGNDHSKKSFFEQYQNYKKPQFNYIDIKEKKQEKINISNNRNYNAQNPRENLNFNNFPMYSEKNLLTGNKNKQAKSSTKRSRHKQNSRIARNTSRSQIKQSSVMNYYEKNVGKRIQNRLKLSEIVYQDSKFKNIKHEINHLFMTYENQTKARRDIKQKINNYPCVLRKYGMAL